jgi:DNA-binding transcriptional LysR family regulator
MILGNQDLTTTPLLHGLIEPWRSKLAVHAEVGSIMLMATLIARGLGIGFSSRFGFEAALADGRLHFIPLQSPGPVHTRLAAYARAEQSSPAVLQAFAAVLDEELARRCG